MTGMECSDNRWYIEKGVPTTALELLRAQWKGFMRWGGLGDRVREETYRAAGDFLCAGRGMT